MPNSIKETPILTGRDAVNFYEQKAVDEKFKKKRLAYTAPALSPTPPLPEAQPLDGVKTAEEILNKAVTGSYNNNDWITSDLGDSHCYAAMEEYADQRIAQFATDAGGRKESEIELLVELDTVRNNTYDLGMSKNKRTSWFKSYLKNAHAKGIYLTKQAPSTHSSSEMVEKKSFAFTYEQLLTLPWYWGEENGEKFTHCYKPGYDNIDGNTQYFGTSKGGMRIISVNADYAGHTYVEILCDGGTRKGFNGRVRSFEELQLINSLVL